MKTMNNFVIKEVISKREIKDFLKMPIAIYKDDKNWVRPLDVDIENIFSSDKNKLFKDGNAIRWVVYNDKNESVGRIAAFYNWGLTEREDVKSGGCGFFESIDNQEVAFMLFDTAAKWLLDNGLQAMDGPINFGSRDQFWGLLVDGFTAPMYNMNYHKTYYKNFFESYGFQNYFNQHTYIKYISTEGDLNSAVLEKYNRLMATGEFEFRPITKADYPYLAENFRSVYNKGWSKFDGVAEMTKEESEHLFKQIKPIMDDKLIIFAYHNGKAVGFFIMAPNINEIIKNLNGKFGLWQKLRFMFDLKVRKSCHTINAMVFGVDPDYQGKGIESGLIEAVRIHLGPSKQYKHMELIWIGDFNPLMMRVVETYVNAKRFKQHITYRYMLDKSIEFKRCAKVSASRKVATKE